MQALSVVVVLNKQTSHLQTNVQMDIHHFLLLSRKSVSSFEIIRKMYTRVTIVSIKVFLFYPLF